MERRSFGVTMTCLANRRSPRVIVAHPQTQHFCHLVVGLQEAGCLETFITQLYYDTRRWPFRLIPYLPRRFRARVSDIMSHRHLAQIDSSSVTIINMWAPLIYILVNRLGLAEGFRKWWLLQTARLFSRRAGILAKQKADILIGPDKASLDAFRIAHENNVACILDLSYPHVLTAERIEKEEQRLMPSFAKTFDTIVQSQNDKRYLIDEIKEADAFLVASSFSRRSLMENGVDEHRIHLVPYGVDLEYFQPPEKPTDDSGPLRVLFAGTIGQRKGVGYLLEAVRQLRRDCDISLTLCGQMRNPEVIAPYAADTTHLGLLPASQLRQVYQKADVFVFPSLIEGYGLVLIEAMASGLPIITTPHTMAPDIISDGVEGFIVPIRDLEELKDRILRLYMDRNLTRRMGTAARRKAEQYPWRRYYREVAEVVHKVWETRQSYKSRVRSQCDRG